MKKEKALSLLVVALAALNIVSMVSFVYFEQSVRQELSGLAEMLRIYPATVSVSDGAGVPAPAGLSAVTRSIPIVAVSNEGDGVIGNLTVRLIPGNNNVLISTNPFVEPDIQYSVNKAVVVAKLSSSYAFDRDFVFDFSAGGAQLIGGESAGAATTIATIAALRNSGIRGDTVISGTINTDGTIGEIGGVIEKAKAVADGGYKRFLVPEGQSRVTYYEKVVEEEPLRSGLVILNTRYVPRTIDLREAARNEWGLEVVEVSTIDDALPYFI